jgi:hypothetical protein
MLRTLKCQDSSGAVPMAPAELRTAPKLQALLMQRAGKDGLRVLQILDKVPAAAAAAAAAAAVLLCCCAAVLLCCCCNATPAG